MQYSRYTAGQCSTPPAPTNGAVTGSNSLGDTVTYSCDSGYNLVGSATRTCQPDLTWTASDPTCEVVQCLVLTSPTNGAVSGSNSYGDVLSFTCDTGYNLVTPKWNAGSIRIAQIEHDRTQFGLYEICTMPGANTPANGEMSGSRSYQDAMQFTCHSGYERVGAASITCQADGTWSGNVPSCGAVACPILSAPANGAMSGSNFYQDLVQFTCGYGYDLVGNSALTCQSDATWSGSVPTCTPVQCPILTAPLNGAKTGSNFYPNMVQFSCSSGYNLVGNSALTCQADATWSGTVPTCTRKECLLLTAPTNGAMTGSNFYQDVLTFTCNSGYNLLGNPSLTCQADATWSGTVPICPPVECPLLTAPVNGAMFGSNFYQDIIQFNCNPGYELDGSSNLACQVDASWSGSVPTCERVQCPLQADPANGAKTGSNFYEDVVHFTCYSGHDLVGNPTITCQADATWSGSAPTCSRIECPVLTAPVNGAMFGNNFFQDVVEFTCNSGYDRVGTSSLSCQADRTWNGVVPTCTRVQCPIQAAPANGVVTGGNFYQDAVLFTCDTGYELVGTSSLTCQADRTWDGVAPTCTRVECPALTAPVNGKMTGFNFYQDLLQFTCDTGYDLFGRVSLTCQADRTWDGVAPTCTRVQCPPLPSPVNGASTGNNFYMDTVHFTCNLGYYLIGDSLSTCQADQSWSRNVPSCNDIDECSIANGGCQQNCNNFIGSFQCSCGTGYNLNSDGFACDDEDECFIANGGCDQTCSNTIGNFSCSCGTGYNLNSNGFFCDDVDECSTLNGGCEQMCTNTIGSFQCSCQNGYGLNSDGFACDDVDECASGNGGCEQTCTNNIPGFQCSCHVGYNLNVNGFTCDDVDECSSVNGGCEHSCTNNIGSFQCSCLHGYILNTDDLACDDINECSTANGGCNQTCTNLIASFECSCGAGYSLNDDGVSCDDINECNTANGGCSHVCNNTIGSFECFCSTGYMLNVDGFACDDIDECDTANGGCGQFCTNTVGSFSCYCAPGYSLGVDLLSCDGFSQHSPKTSVRSAGNTNATIPGLFSGVRYSISVLSFGLWNDSANVSIECITGLPPPTNITITLARQESVLVHWSQPVRTLVLGYRAWLTDKETSSIISSRHLSQSATSANFTSLVPATEYVVSVSCVSAFFEGPQIEVSFVTDTDSPLRLFVDGIRYNSLALFWTPPVAKLTRYELKFTSTKGHRNRRATSSVTLPGNSDNYLIQDLVPATQYVFSLTAVSRFGRSGAITFTGTTGTDPPSDLKVHKVSSIWLYVKWTPPVAAVVSYHLEVLEAESLDEMHFSTTPSLTAYNITKLLPTTKYIVRIAAVSMYGRSVNIETFGSTGEVIEYSTSASPTSAAITTESHNAMTQFRTIEAFWITRLYSSTNTDSTRDVKTFALEELETTSVSTTTVNGNDREEQNTLKTTFSLLQSINSLKDHVDRSLRDKAPPDDVVSIVTEIHDLVQLDTFPVSSSDFLIELELAVELLCKSSELIRASQGTTISTMETINDVIVQTVSRLVQMLPVGNSTVPDTSEGLFKMDVIDVNSADVSPKQQLKDIQNKQTKFQLQFRNAGLCMTEAMDRAVNSLLAMLPYLEDYVTAFEDDNAIMVVMERNLFSWNSSTFGQNVTTPIVIFSLGDQHTDNCGLKLDLSMPIALGLTEQPRRRRRALLEDGFVATQFTSHGADGLRIRNLTMAYHAFDVPDAAAVVVMQLSWWDHAAAYRVFFRYDSPPTEELYDDMKMVMVEDVVFAWHRETDSSRTWIPDIKRRQGKLYVGIQTSGIYSQYRPRTLQQTIPSPEDYELRASTVSCLSWDYTSEKWGNTECGVLLDLSSSAIKCNCSFSRPKAVIGGSVHFPPNSIDFDNVFGNPDGLTSNIVFYAVIGEWAVYLLLMIILNVDFQRLRDKMGYVPTAANRKERLAQLSILPPDRMPAPYLYQITVNTGSMFGAGTSARIGLQVFGSMGKTAVKTLNPRGEFVCYVWLSDVRGDCQVQKVLHAATREQLESFSTLLRENTNALFYDQHMWTSAIVTPEGSSFSKSERLSCCWAIVNSMMVASAMWYRDNNVNSTSDSSYNLGFVTFTLQELYVILVTTVLVIPVTTIPLLLFRKEIPVPVLVPGIKRSPKQAGKHLSRWTKYVAWLILVSVSIVSSFFVITYGLDWGKEKSESWLKAFCFSFCLSSVVAETGQVYPPGAASVQRMKRKNEQRQKFLMLLRDYSLLFLFVVVLFFISQQDKDPFAFHASQTLSSRLTEDFDSITTPDDFWTWIEEVMLPVLYPSLWYNGWKMKYLDRNVGHGVCGSVIPPDTPEHLVISRVYGNIRACTRHTSQPGSWEPGCGHRRVIVRVQESIRPDQRTDVHPSGLYTVSRLKAVLWHKMFAASRQDTEERDVQFVPAELKDRPKCVQRFTGGVCRRVQACTRPGHLSGSYPGRVQARTRQVYGSRTPGNVRIFGISGRVYGKALAVKKYGMTFFGSIWNLMASLSILVSAIAICTFGIRYQFASEALDKIVEATGELGIDTFVDLGPSFWWDDAFKYVLASVVFVNTLALLRMVKFNKTIAHFLALPGAMKNDLMGFSLVSAIAFMAFSSSGMVVFGTHKKAFTNFIHTNFALFEMTLGSFDTEEILEANRYVGPVYFTFFMICIFIILVNFLVTIICDAIASRASIDDDYDQDLVDYIWTSFKEILGIHSAPINDETAGEVKLAELKANLRTIEDSLGDILDVTECLWPKITSDLTSSHPQRHHSTTMPSDTCQMIQEEATSPTTPAVSDVQEQARCLLKAHEDDTARIEEVRNEGRRRAEAILKRKLADRRIKSRLDQTARDTAQELMEQHTADVARMEERQKGARRMFENKLRQKLAARRVQKKDNAI
ncbi:hypothetical protein Bbelb_155510 [Branchiostoma belcheri]|nr:hypothetical protein Bbelb_155510 [Branchiostoma belcheri]